MAHDVARAKPLFDQDRERFRQFLTAQATVARTAAAVMLIDGDLDVVERSRCATDRRILALPTKDALANIERDRAADRADPGVQLRRRASSSCAITTTSISMSCALLDPRVVAQLRETRASVTEYAALEARRLGVQSPSG